MYSSFLTHEMPDILFAIYVIDKAKVDVFPRVPRRIGHHPFSARKAFLQKTSEGLVHPNSRPANAST
jgi:hypothetical protein